MGGRVEKAIRNLVKIDQQLSQLHRVQKIRFIIFGGTAFLLETDHRATWDIDIVLLDKITSEEMSILNENYVNNNMQGVMHIPPLEEIISRMRPLNIDFQRIEVYLPHPHDLIFSKLLGRADQRDINDVVYSGILDKIDLEQLKEEYNDYVKYTLNPNRCPKIETILEEYKANKR